MRLDGLDIYVEGLAVHLAYQFRHPFRVWSDLSDAECENWKNHAYDLLAYLKKQKFEVKGNKTVCLLTNKKVRTK